MNPVLAQFLKDNIAFVIVAGVALVVLIAAIVLVLVTKRSAATGFFSGTKRLVVHYTWIAALLVILLFANFVLYSFAGTITQALCGFGITVDKTEAEETSKSSAAVCEELCTEGFTLLKNENNALPLTDNKVNVFGWSGSDKGFIHQGGGSGGGNDVGIVKFYQGLRDSGIEINEDLAAAYNALPYESRGWGSANYIKFGNPEPEEDFYSEERMSAAKAFSDTALIVMSRYGTETSDLPRNQYKQNGRKVTDRIYSEISAQEELMIEKVTAVFDKVIVVLNVTNVMELGFLENDKIDACFAMYAPGTKGTPALGPLLLGEKTFSGRTVDTWAYDLSTAAAWENSGAEGSYWPKGAGKEECVYSLYSEDIYVGYYWYETADAEGFWDSSFAKRRWNIENGYEDVVQFPFGFGLSYTDFEWTVTEMSVPDRGNISADTEISVKVFVENVGTEYAGQDVVQLYISAPYTEGGIEKPAVRLAAFAKTGVLKPGQGEELTLTVRPFDIASYDCYDRNNNGFMGYELEGGEYGLSLRTDAHTVKLLGGDKEASYTFNVPSDGFRYERDPDSGNKVENRFTNYTNPSSGASSQVQEYAISDRSKAYSVDASDTPFATEYMTRADFAGTFPEHGETVKVPDDFYSETWLSNTAKVNEGDEMPVTESTETTYTLNDFVVDDGEGGQKLIDLSDPKWDALVSQLSVNTMAEFCAKGGFGTVAIWSVNKPFCVDLDGPSGFSRSVTGSDSKELISTNFPCETLIASTWNWKMAYKFGLALGTEGNTFGIDGIYGPGANIHRSALNGRNFEYYSEDPFISGIMAAYSVYGAKEKGVYCWIKHFVLNENEEGRLGMYQWCTEQALREIYLRPFELAVKKGGTVAMMTSYGRVGSVRASGSYALCTLVLRNEWGFEGAVITDYYNGGAIHDADECIRAGNDLMLNPNGTPTLFDDRSSATAVKALQQSTKSILYCYLNARYTAVNSQGLDLSSLIGTKTEPYAWWVPVTITMDCVLAAGLVTLGVLLFVKRKKSPPAPAQEE